MRVTIGQINTTNGDYEGNVARILDAIEKAKKDASDLIVFPEVTIQGYTSLDWFLDPDVVRLALQPLDKIIDATEGLTAIVGTVRPSDQATGRALFNSAAVIRNRMLLGFADKTLLPEYDVFDDPRYFEPGRERRLFNFDETRLGIAVCEDFWNDKTLWKQRLYANDPAEEFIGTIDLYCRVTDTRCWPGDDIETVRQALVLGLRDYALKNRFTTAVFGLSGGIDSAVVATLACEALGSDNVLAVMMPSPYTSRASIEDSIELGRRLGMRVIERPISEAFQLLRTELELPEPKAGGSSHAVENLQSRLRGNILMTISNAQGRLLLSTGNKSELALGYCTLYGDTNGGLAVIGDVLKTEVYELARLYNREREVIPQIIIDKRPSAELAPGQFDDQSLPPYDKLDPILQLYFEKKESPEEIIAAGHDPDLVYDILHRVESPAKESKRRQLPPTLIISRNAIGIGRRRPVTHRYRRQPKYEHAGVS